MSRSRGRHLWLEIKFKVPKNVSGREVIQTLIRSIRNGTYIYPSTWKVKILWRNKEHYPMKEDEFTNAMIESSQSSVGFDNAVISYLENR